MRPQIVTFADPIFHFGPSTYAHQFQRALGRLAVRHDFTVVTLERYAALLRDRLPQLADRIVGVRLGLPYVAAELRPDVGHSRSKPYPNILTMLMLPLAATFSRSHRAVRLRRTELRRRPTSGDTARRFSSTRSSRTSSSSTPGFFELDYGDYYDQHVAAVEQMFLDIEFRGGRITPRTPSFMLPLRRRSPTQRPSAPASPHADRSVADAIVSITPDWTGDFGHFGPWERAVGAARGACGYDVSVACRVGRLESHRRSVVPTLHARNVASGDAPTRATSRGRATTGLDDHRRRQAR